MDLSTQDQQLITLAEKGGKDAELMLLDLLHFLQDEIAGIKSQYAQEMKDMMVKMEEHKPIMDAMMTTMTEIAKKEIPAPVINIQPTKVEVKAPQVTVLAPDLPEPVIIPAPIVNVKAEVVAKDNPEIQNKLDELQKEIDLLKVKKDKPLTIYGPGKTRIILIDLSSQLDGVTKTFALGTHFGIISVNGSSAPFGAFRPTVDYNESGRNIVFTSNVDASISLAQGQSLIVKVLR